MQQPETRYARSGDVSIAYQVIGDGPFDIVQVPGFVSNVSNLADHAIVIGVLIIVVQSWRADTVKDRAEAESTSSEHHS